MDTFIENSFCRCCSSEGTFKDVSTRYHWMGEEEIYADMLKQCFNIILLTTQENRGGICELCISQLRSAANFKKQVLHTEIQFKKILENKQPVEDTIEFVIKSELETQDGDVSDDNDNVSDTGDPDYVTPDFDASSVKEETEEPPRPTKRAAQPSTSRAKKTKTEQPETSAKRVCGRKPPVVNVQVKLESYDSEDEDLLILSKRKMSESKISVDKIPCDTQKEKKPKESSENVMEIKKHRLNIRTILQCTNATPFLKRSSSWYTCSFCAFKFPKPDLLKSHTLDNHKSEIKSFMTKATLATYSVNIDITNMKCTLCGTFIESLDKVIDHLKEVHHQKIFTDVNNHILPFKFEDNILKCVFCLKPFNNFKTLSRHLNSHYQNYCCEVCSATFVNRNLLKLHESSHENGQNTCSVCGKIFHSVRSYSAHMRSVHVKRSVISKCPSCNETFTCAYTRINHMEKEHGIQPVMYPCKACDKTFKYSAMLSLHVRRDHLLERRYECSICNRKFFAKINLDNHMIIHSGERKYRCDYCSKTYARKKTLVEHLRIHRNDRRFKCEQCGQAFVQKCNWRNHVRSKHDRLIYG